MSDDPIMYGYDYEPEYELANVTDGFTEKDKDGKVHKVSWEMSEVAPGFEDETWWCTTHDRLYYGGCNKVDKPYGR